MKERQKKKVDEGKSSSYTESNERAHGRKGRHDSRKKLSRKNVVLATTHLNRKKRDGSQGRHKKVGLGKGAALDFLVEQGDTFRPKC